MELITVKQRLEQLRGMGFTPFGEWVKPSRNYGMSNLIEARALIGGFELVQDFRHERAGDMDLVIMTHKLYVHADDREMPTMLRVMQPRIQEVEMQALLEPLGEQENTRTVEVGKSQITKRRIINDRVNYDIMFQLHRIVNNPPLAHMFGLSKIYDFLLPHTDYYTK